MLKYSAHHVPYHKCVEIGLKVTSFEKFVKNTARFGDHMRRFASEIPSGPAGTIARRPECWLRMQTVRSVDAIPPA